MPQHVAKTHSEQNKKPVKQLWAIVALLLLINIAAYFFYGQLDLTQDRRYTITPATKNMLRSLHERVEITVFLKGEDLPAAFKRLSRSTEEMLRHFRDISDNRVTYRSIDPLGSDTTALAVLSRYRMSGIPVTVSAGKKGTAQKMIFPWALVVRYDDQNREHAFPVFLQESNTPELSRTILLRSEMLLEYNLANAIHQLTKREKAAIAYLTGNGEPFGYDILAAFSTLGRYYKLDTFNLSRHQEIPAIFDALIINRPLHGFSEADKFKIDQYLMQGKAVYWNVDGATGSLDSFSRDGTFNSMPLDLNLDDLFYNYGLRLNHNLLEDAVSSAGIPLTAQGKNAQPVMYPWVYFPVLQSGSDHPVVKHLNGVLGRFVSTIDTNANDPGVKKTILLRSSDYSQTSPTPAPVILESAMIEKNPASFRKKRLAAAVLLEGRFTSAYANRRPAEVLALLDSTHIPVLRKAKRPGKMIVAADGELMMNEVSPQTGPSDMGSYRFSDYHFDNKAFLLNCMEYLTDPDNLLAARTKRFDNHLLDPERVEKERGKWQFINIGVPVISVVLLGLIFFFIRKRKYG